MRVCAPDSGSPTGVTFTSSQVIRGLKSKCALVEVQVSRPVSRLGPSLSLAQILPSGKGLAILPGISPFPNLQGVSLHSELYPGIPRGLQDGPRSLLGTLSPGGDSFAQPPF